MDNRQNHLAAGDPTIILVVFLAAAALWNAWHMAMSMPAMDFYHYRTAALAVSRGRIGNIYSADGRAAICRDLVGREATVPRTGKRRFEPAAVSEQEKLAARVSYASDREALGFEGLETIATPFLLTAFRPLAAGDYESDYRTYVGLCLACYAAAVLSLGRLCGYAAAGCWAAVAVLTTWFEPLASEIRVANINAIQLAIVALFLLLQRGQPGSPRRIVAGFVLALGVMLKPNLLWIVLAIGLLWMVNRRWRALLNSGVGMAAGCLGAWGVSAAAFGTTSCWRQWLDILPQVIHTARPVVDGNIAVGRLLFERFGVDLSGYLTAALAIALAAAALLGRRRKPDTDEPAAPRDRTFWEAYLGASAGAAVMALSGRLVWLHYLVLLVPALLYGLRPAGPVTGQTSRRLGFRLAALMSLLALSSFSNLLPRGPIFAGVANKPLLFDLAVLLIFGLLTWEIGRGGVQGPGFSGDEGSAGRLRASG